MTTGLLRSLECSDVVAEPVNIVQRGGCQKPVNLREITKRGSRERVSGIQGPGDLAGIERNGDLIRNRVVEGLRQVEVAATLGIEGAEKPQLVFLDWTTDVDACVDLREAVESRSCEREILYATDEALCGSVTKNVAVKFVTTALGDYVKDSAGGLAILWTISTGFDFDFLDEFEGKVCARSAKRGVGCIHAVQNVVVLGA